MLPQLFDLSGSQLVPHTNCYAVPWLKRIMDVFPDDYIQVYSYIFFMTCPDSTNPYIAVHEDLKESVILADLGELKFSLEDEVMRVAYDKCKKLYETPILRAYVGAKKMVDKIALYLDESEIIDGAKEGNAMTIDRWMSKLPDYVEMYDKLEVKLKEEQSKVRGGRIIPYYQLEGYKDTKEYEQ